MSLALLFHYLYIDALISQFYFWNKTLRVSDSSSVHYQEFFYHCTHSTVICHTGLLTACERDRDGTPQTRITYTIAVCTVKKKLLMMYRGTVRNM